MAAAVNLRLIDEFCDTLWLEQGLAKNSLDAYRRDLRLFARWLELKRPGCASLHTAQPEDIAGYFADRHPESKPSSANRRLSVLKRFYQLALRQRQVSTDPCLNMASAKQPTRFVNTLTEGQVEALLEAPDCATPLGLRERTMLELMYASGLRVSELVALKLVELSLNDGVLRVTGKGSKTRLVPFGQEARQWLERYLKDDPGRPGRRCAVRHQPRRGDDAPDVLGHHQEACRQGGDPGAAVAAHAAPRVRHPPAEPRRRPACRAIATGTRRYLHHTDLHACCA
jgi:integrase/recombinase XerD